MTESDDEEVLSDYFTTEQLSAMGAFERRRNLNLISNYKYMMSLGFPAAKPCFMNGTENNLAQVPQQHSPKTDKQSSADYELFSTELKLAERHRPLTGGPQAGNSRLVMRLSGDFNQVEDDGPEGSSLLPSSQIYSDERGYKDESLNKEEQKLVKTFNLPVVRVLVEKLHDKHQHFSKDLGSDECAVPEDHSQLMSSHTNSDKGEDKDESSTEEEDSMVMATKLDEDGNEDEDEDVTWLFSVNTNLELDVKEEEGSELKKKTSASQKENHPIKCASPTNDNQTYRVSPEIIHKADIQCISPKRECMSVSNDVDFDVDDCYIYCEDCHMQYVDGCSLHPWVVIHDFKVAVGVADRARVTLPPGLSLSDSKVQGAGKGVWTDREISKFTRFGPYEGITRLCNVKTDKMTAYEWLVTGVKTHYIDGQDTTTANWLRYVKCARTEEEQNLKAFQYEGKIYYKTLTDIPPGHELFVWYGDYVDIENAHSTSASISTGSEECCFELNTAGLAKKCNDFDFRCALESQPIRHPKARAFGCSQSFVLQSHKKSHTVDKAFACVLCNYKGAHSWQLQNHMITHTSEKSFMCSQCGYKCASEHRLRRHITTHTGEKPFACALCDYRSSRSYTLRVHMRTHTGEKPFACTLCNYRSTVAVTLKRHMRIHTNEKPFACTHCEYKCNQLSHLKVHMKTHSRALGV